MVGFLFGGNTGQSYEQLQQRRQLADQLAAQIMGTQPKNTMEGIGALLKGAAAGIGRYRADKGMTEGRSQADKLFEQIIGPGGAALGVNSSSYVNPNANASVPASADVASLANSPDIIADVLAAGGNPVDVRGSSGNGSDWLSYANQGATRSQPLNGKLVEALSFLPEMGLGMEVFSGGQPEAGKGPRTGSTRHDHGNAADVFFTKDGRRLNWADEADRPIFEDVVRRAKANGVTGIGAGDGYMQPGSMHIGFGSPAVWGAGGKGVNAPDWLRNAYYGGRQVASLDPGAGMPPAAAAIEQQAPQGAQANMLPPLPAGRDVGPAPGMSAPQPQQMAQNAFPPAPQPQQSNGLDPAVPQLLSNPFLAPEKKAVLQMLMQQQMQTQQQAQQEQAWRARQDYEMQMKRSDPGYQLGLTKAQLEVDAMRNPQPKPTDDIREYEFAKSQGFTGSLQDWIVSQKKAGATNVTTNVGEGDKFYENLDRKNAETFSAMSDSGIQARSRMGQIDRLQGLMANAPQGAVGALKQAAGEWGIATDGLSDIQAASALLEKMVPEQRAPGSGPMSDADIKMFRASLPRVLNQPGGNQLIFDTMRGITQYEVQMGEIADKVADRIITPAEGRRLIRELENPLAGFKIPEGGTPNEGWKELSPGVKIRKLGD